MAQLAGSSCSKKALVVVVAAALVLIISAAGWGGEEEEGAGVPHGGELRDRVVRRQVQGVGLHRPRRRLLHLRRHAHPLLLRLRRRRRQRLARRPPPVISTSITTSSSFFSDPSTHRRLLLVQLNCYKNWESIMDEKTQLRVCAVLDELSNLLLICLDPKFWGN